MSVSIGYLLSDDLLFISRITGVARDLGLAIRSVRDSIQLVEQVRLQPPVCIILDLANPGLELGNVLEQVKQICQPCPRLVGYGSHVDVATLKAARELGCDPVLPRSKFVEQLPEALPMWWKPT